jgi:hypothetical protein
MIEAEVEARGREREQDREAFIEDFAQLKAREEALLAERRNARGIASDEPRFGFAVSGGGIRSAAFGLGVTRALHDKGVYDRLDYLSTVGGGGFTSTFVNWLRRRDSGLDSAGELLPESALHFVRHNADYLNPASADDDGEVLGDDAARRGPAPTSATLIGVVLGQMLLSLTVCASLLVGLFFLLQVGDALVTLQKPILLLATRNDVWRFFVTQLNFASVAGLVVLATGALRILGTLLGRAWRGAWNAAVPAGGSPRWSDTWRGSLWLLLGLISAALTIAALSMLAEGVAPWIASFLLAFASKSCFARCKAHWHARAAGSERNGIWLLLPVAAAALVSGALVSLFAFYLFMSGQRPIGDPAVLSRSGGVLALAIGVVSTLWLLPRTFRNVAHFFAHWPAKIDLHASYQRSLAFQRKSGSTLVTAGVWFVLGSIPWWEELAEHALGSRSSHLHVFGGALGFATLWICLRVVTSSRAAHRRRLRLTPGQRSVLLGLVLYGLLVLAHGVTAAILDSSLPHHALWLTAIGLVLGSLTDLNFAGAGRVYKNRVAETFLPDTRAIRHHGWLPARAAAAFPLWKLSDVEDRGPYQLLNTSLITDGSESRKHGQRGSDSFILSPLFCGSAATGWAATHHWQRGRLTLADALAISSAATSPGAGFDAHGSGRSRLVAAGLSVFNLRLYYCADNPNPRYTPRPSRRRPNLLVPGLRSMLLGAESETSRHVRLSDGAHFEALGLYELLRRKVELIVVSDATEDAKHDFSALGKALERAREDLGVEIEFEAGKVFGGSVAPGLYSVAATPGVRTRGFAIGTIRYRDTSATGTLIYVKPTLVEGLDVAVQSFAAEYAEFPAMPCADKLFDERQFIAYEQLGHEIGLRALDEGLARESAHLDSVTPPRYDSFIQLKGNASTAKAG